MKTEEQTARCEVLWHFYDKTEKKHVERWLPATLFSRNPHDGRCHVRADNGWVAIDAAPECVRNITPVN